MAVSEVAGLALLAFAGFQLFHLFKAAKGGDLNSPFGWVFVLTLGGVGVLMIMYQVDIR